jgi:hypothetical protein
MNRVIRTTLQVLLAVLVAVPAAVAALEAAGLQVNGAVLVGIAGAAVVIVSAVQNALEDSGALPPYRKD